MFEREGEKESEKVKAYERNNISDLILIFIFSTRHEKDVFSKRVQKRRRKILYGRYS